jgi:hypothetical protein
MFTALWAYSMVSRKLSTNPFASCKYPTDPLLHNRMLISLDVSSIYCLTNHRRLLLDRTTNYHLLCPDLYGGDEQS